MANKIPRVPVREQDPKVRATNFEEVCYGYNVEEATLEASRCLNCKNPRCVAACPVKRGSTWMTSAPLSFALSTHLNEIGWFSAALLP